MIIHNCEQGTIEWSNLRLGIPTASEFHRIVTPTGALSAQSRDYAYRLVAESLLMRPLSEDISNLPQIQHGKEYEAEAVRSYEFDNGVKTVKVGFMTNDAGDIGASPDRLVDDCGVLEIKCPQPATMVAYHVSGVIDAKYKPQIQGQLMVSGRNWCDWLAYSREMPTITIRTLRDDEYIEKLSKALADFVHMKNDIAAKLLASGFFNHEIINPAARPAISANHLQ